jgi:DNA-binding transcriptional ArsR family regulator
MGNHPHYAMPRFVASFRRPLREEGAMAKAEDEKYKALAHPLRRALLSEMSTSGRTLAYLVRRTGAAPSRVSNHLRLMEQARLVNTRQRSGGRVYSLRKEGLQQVLAFLKGLVGPS